VNLFSLLCEKMRNKPFFRYFASPNLATFSHLFALSKNIGDTLPVLLRKVQPFHKIDQSLLYTREVEKGEKVAFLLLEWCHAIFGRCYELHIRRGFKLETAVLYFLQAISESKPGPLGAASFFLQVPEPQQNVQIFQFFTLFSSQKMGRSRSHLNIMWLRNTDLNVQIPSLGSH
jgi:hypothetical protein